jgi:hypothetical protein
MLRSLDGHWEGDPRKIADVIVQLANSDEVPVRLILGEAARTREAEKWAISRFRRCLKMGSSTAD